MPQPLRVFLCHASQDKPAVRELYNALKREGWIDPWLDKAKILPGQDWEMVIEKAVDDSDVVIVCLSSQSVSKEGFVQREIRYAYDIALEKPEETIFLIPLRLDNCIVPRKLKSLHWVDYFDSEKDEAYSNLLEALKLRHEQKLKAEDAQREQERQAKKEEEFARQLAAERAAREKAEQEVKTEREARLKWERDLAGRVAHEWEEVKSGKEKPVVKPTPRVERKRPAPVVIEDKPVKPFPLWAVYASIILVVVAFSIWGVSKLFDGSAPATEALVTEQSAATETSVAEFGIGSTTISEKDGMTLVFVPEGEFTMGSDADDALAECQKYRSDCERDWFLDEEPPHQVFLNAFWMDETEVTNAMYARCVADGGCTPPASNSSYTHDDYYGNSEFDNYPMINVNWEQANTYCSWAERELPSEAKWEKAARGTGENIYPWGNTFDGTSVNFCDVNCDYSNANKSFNDGYADVSPVGNYPSGQSHYGALDMAGNVWEWVSDWYDVYPGGDVNASSDFGETYRVLRGGSWNVYVNGVRSAVRDWNDPSDTRYLLGFRCSLSHP